MLDYHFPEKDIVKFRWKSAIVRIILYQREVRKKGSWLANMMAKLQAIVSCEEAGNFDLADKVLRGEIPPHYIMEDGTLDPAASKNDINASLPRTHPVIKAFRHIFDSITQPSGSIFKQYGVIERSIGTQSDKLKLFDQQLSDMKNKLLLLVENISENFPLKEGRTPQLLQQELEELLKFQEQRRHEKQEALLKKVNSRGR